MGKVAFSSFEKASKFKDCRFGCDSRSTTIEQVFTNLLFLCRFGGSQILNFNTFSCVDFYLVEILRHIKFANELVVYYY